MRFSSKWIAGAVALCAAGAAFAQEVARRDAAETRAKAVKYLLAAQDKDGGWASDTGPGVSCLVLRALLGESEIGTDNPAIKRGVDFVLRSQRSDGGIYATLGLHKNYESAVALSALSALKSEDQKTRVAALQKFLIENQWDEADGKTDKDAEYGGAGYGLGRRPDMSNTQMMLEALHDSGLPEDSPVFKKALIFIQRSQMRGESNDLPFARGSTQGGFIYTPVSKGESKAGEIEIDGRKELRCYGSMTYAGYKSLLYCGLGPTDPRVAAALDWMKRNWTLDRNPNMPDRQSSEGLYYYYHVFGRALQASGYIVITDAAGREHNWREELTETLAKRQRNDGSWINEEDRWMEGLPALTTSYALLALQATDR